MWYQGGPDPDHAVDVTATFPRKVAALAAHVTQTSHEDVVPRMRALAELNARRSGLPEGSLAEAFTVLRTA